MKNHAFALCSVKLKSCIKKCMLSDLLVLNNCKEMMNAGLECKDINY